MTNTKNNPSQVELLKAPGVMQMDATLSAAFAQDLKHSIKSRQTMASELTDLLGRTITPRHLENWAAPSHKGHRIPLDVAAAILLVTNDSATLEAAAEAVGSKVITRRDIDYLALSKKQVARQRLDRDIEEIERRLR